MGGEEAVSVDEGNSHIITDPYLTVTDNDKNGSDSDGDGAEEVYH